MSRKRASSPRYSKYAEGDAVGFVIRHTAHVISECMEWLQLALSRSVVRRASAVALVVGSLLIAINHGDALLGD